MSTEGMTEQLADGRPHAMPCPAERHGKDPGAVMLYVRYLTTDGLWLLHCWGRPACDYAEIVRLLNIDTNPTRTIRRSPVAHLVAAYDHVDPDERPRLVFHSWRGEADSPLTPGPRGSREMGIRGGANDTHLMFWAPEDVDGSRHTLLVVGSEEAAIALMQCGVYREGFVPVTWYRAVTRLKDDQASVDRVVWSRVRGRQIAFWPVRTSHRYAEMLRAAGMATVAGATRLLLVDTQGPGLREADDAASLTDPEQIMGVLRRMRVLPGLHDDETVWDTWPEVAADAADEMSDIARILEPGVETATDVAMAVRLLREHGCNMVLASRQTASNPAVEVYWRTATGALEKRPHELGTALWRSRGRYVEEMRAARDAGELSSEEYKACIAHANRMGSPAGLRAVADSLGTAYGILERLGAVPSGLLRVNSSDIGVDTRHRGEPNKISVPDTSHLSSRVGGCPLTEADVWLLEAIEITGNPRDRLSSSALWEAALSAPGSGADPAKVWGMSRRPFTTRAIQLHGLPRTRSVRIEGQVFSGWAGVRLTVDIDDTDS